MIILLGESRCMQTYTVYVILINSTDAALRLQICRGWSSQAWTGGHLFWHAGGDELKLWAWVRWNLSCFKRDQHVGEGQRLEQHLCYTGRVLISPSLLQACFVACALKNMCVCGVRGFLTVLWWRPSFRGRDVEGCYIWFHGKCAAHEGSRERLKTHQSASDCDIYRSNNNTFVCW